MTGAPPVTTTTFVDSIAETREWELLEGNDEMTHPQTTSAGPHSLPSVTFTLDERVLRLIEGDYEDGPESLMGDLQSALRQGDRRLASQLAAIASSSQHSAEVRSLALETLAAARARSLEPITAEVVRVALEAPNSRLQFAGIAAVSDLSRSNQVLLSRVVRELIASPNASAAVKRAGAAFLRRRV